MRPARRQSDEQGISRAVQATGLTGALLIGAYLMAAASGATRGAWLGWFSLLPLFVAIRLWRPSSAMLAGALWGICLYAFSLGQPEAAISPGIPTLLLLSATPAVYAWAGAWLTRRIGFSPLVLGVGWTAVGYAFGQLGLRDGVLVGAVGQGTFIHWVASALGYVVAAFLVAYVNASLVSVLSAVRPSIPGERYATRSDDGGTCLPPQTAPRLPVFALGPVQPRAPPGPPATP